MTDRPPPGAAPRVRRTPWPASAARPLVPPLQPSAVYVAESPDALDAQYVGEVPGYAYAREGHPNADQLAARLDALEGAAGGIVTGSGMGAVAAVLFGLLSAGDHVVGGDQLYGRTHRLLAEDLPRLGIASSRADATDAAAVAAALRPRTRLILIETVSNPALRVADLEGIAALARARGIPLAVDNTFTTPRALRPFAHGADIVLHSVTKLLAGHSDATLGWVAAADPGTGRRLAAFAASAGLTPSPFDCWLALRGLETFPLRYDRAEATARVLADRLAAMPGVRRVIYPGRDDHPDRPRARRLLGERTGTMLSFEIAGGRGAANAFVRAAAAAPDGQGGLAFAPTLGDVGTTLSHPASSSHRDLPPEARAALGFPEGFFRLSVGLEEVEALAADLARGAAAAAAAAAEGG